MKLVSQTRALIGFFLLKSMAKFSISQIFWNCLLNKTLGVFLNFWLFKLSTYFFEFSNFYIVSLTYEILFNILPVAKSVWTKSNWYLASSVHLLVLCFIRCWPLNSSTKFLYKYYKNLLWLFNIWHLITFIFSIVCFAFLFDDLVKWKRGT